MTPKDLAQIVPWMRARAKSEARMAEIADALEGRKAATERKLLALALIEGADAIEKLFALRVTGPHHD